MAVDKEQQQTFPLTKFPIIQNIVEQPLADMFSYRELIGMKSTCVAFSHSMERAAHKRRYIPIELKAFTEEDKEKLKTIEYVDFTNLTSGHQHIGAWMDALVAAGKITSLALINDDSKLLPKITKMKSLEDLTIIDGKAEFVDLTFENILTGLNLRSLTLRGTKICGDRIEIVLAPMPNLRTVDFSGNHNLAGNHLLKLPPSVTRLILIDCPNVTQKQKDRLKEKFPNIEITDTSHAPAHASAASLS